MLSPTNKATAEATRLHGPDIPDTEYATICDTCFHASDILGYIPNAN